MQVRCKLTLRHLTVWLCAGILAYFAARVLLGGLAACWAVHRLAADEPALRVVPSPLPDARIAALSGSRVERFGISIQLPWKVVTKERSFGSIDTLWFSNGAAVQLWGPAMQVDALGVMRKSGAAAVNRILGVSADHSNYALTVAAMSTTPDQAKWWSTPRENARCLLLMTVKSQDVLWNRTIHPIALGVMRGFQFGDASDPMVRLVLFDAQGRKYMITMGPKRGTASPLTQALINAMVASLRPIPAANAPGNLPPGHPARS